MAYNTRKEELSAMLDKKLDEKFEKLEKSFSQSLVSQIKEEVAKEVASIVNKYAEKIDKLESTVCMLQKHVEVLKNQTKSSLQQTEENEQYGRRLCLRMGGLKVAEGKETASDVLQMVKENWEKGGVNVPDPVIDRAHRIGNKYKEKDKEGEFQDVIVRFTTFRHRTEVYHGRKKMEMRVRLDLTKTRYNTLKEGIKFVEKVEGIEFVYADINCRLKVKFSDGRVFSGMILAS